MFEALITMCALSGSGVCRDMLLPGHEAADVATCMASLTAGAPDLPRLFPDLVAGGDPVCAPVGAPLSFEEVAPGVFVHVGQVAEPNADNAGDISNFGFVIGTDAVAVIDSGTARWMGEGIWRAIRARSDLPVSHVILTHMHPDHVLGASVLAEAGAQVVGHGSLERAMADRRATYLTNFTDLIGAAQFLGTEFASVDRVVEAPLELDLGGRSLRVQAWPSAHTGTDLTVLDQSTDILFAGDLVFDHHTPVLDGSLRGWQGVMNSLANLPLRGVVPGHGGPLLDWPDGAGAMQAYLTALARDTLAAIDAGESMSDAITHIAQDAGAGWQLFDFYNPRNAVVAYTELEWE